MSSTLPIDLAHSERTAVSFGLTATPTVEPYLALVGQRVDAIPLLSTQAQSNFANIETGLVSLMRFAASNDLPESQRAIMQFLASSVNHQTASYHNLVNDIVEEIAAGLPDLPYRLTPQSNGYGNDHIGLYICTQFFLAEIDNRSPDPLLDTLWAQMVHKQAKILGFRLAEEGLEWGCEMEAESLGLSTQDFRDHAEGIKTAIQNESLETINALVGFAIDEHEDEDYVLARLASTAEMIDNLDQRETVTDITWDDLISALDAVVKQHPRLAYLPRVERALRELPQWQANCQRFETIKSALRDEGDIWFGTHTLVITRDLNDSEASYIEYEQQHIFEGGEEGYLAVDLAHPHALEALELWANLAFSFYEMRHTVETY